MNRQWLNSKLSDYSTLYEEERAFAHRFLHLLTYDNCFERSLLTGHITASAWTLTPDLQQVVLLHHKKLDKWLQPGGHTDGNENVLEVARKELAEETGLVDVTLLGNSFFDLDIHHIPERKEVPVHEHYDVRFAFISNDPDELRKNSESFEVAWVPLKDVDALVENEPSILRMKEKTLLVDANK